KQAVHAKLSTDFGVFVYGPEGRSGIMELIISRLPDADVGSPLTRPQRRNRFISSALAAETIFSNSQDV
ncbi:MAG: hypothetical protein VXV97_17410, partial [Pseudomonadota bacterium]|nr:hypothetical protein [Pseudomonadota bacterium]